MNVTKKTLLLLSAALACCIAATLLITYAGREEAEEAQTATYYYTNYTGPEALMAANIENASGSVFMVGVSGSYLVSSDYGVAANGRNIQTLFDTVYRLPLEGLLEGASAQDSQYGLTEPQATVLLEDIQEEGLIFRIGGRTPEGNAYYTCLSGDDRVFLMSSAYAELFLADVARYYDLSLYPSLEDEGIAQLSAITVRRDGEVAYRLEQVDYLESSGLAYYALTAPFRLLIGMTQMQEMVLTPLETLAGTRLIPEPGELSQYGLAEGADTLTLSYADGTEATLRIGNEEGNGTYVMSEESGMVVLAPTADLAFVQAGPADIVGSKLVSLNVNAVSSVSLNGCTYTLSGETTDLTVTVGGSGQLDSQEFQDTVFTALNSISVQGAYSPAEPYGSCLLEAEIQTKRGGEVIRLAFYEIDSRRCAVAVDGTIALWCNTAAVNALLSYAA